MLDIRIDGARVLLPGGQSNDLAVGVEDGRLRIDCAGADAAVVLDARGLVLAPGIVDLHGDAFERQIMPRPGVTFPVDLALMDSDRQLVANGITTAFHGVTYTWEPGLRGRENCLAVLEGLERLNGRLACDTRFHLRWETFHLDGLGDVAEWLRNDRIGVLAFNNHAPEIGAALQRGEAAKYAQRTGLAPADVLALAERTLAREGEVESAVMGLAAIAREHGVAMLSHDDPDIATRERYRAMGCAIAEFPKTREAAGSAREHGEAVVFGAPNVVRGGSHTNAVNAAEMIGAGLCDVLASDYYYPAQLVAAFRLADDGVLPLHEAWKLISQNAALAAGLDDRGAIVEGHRADLVLVDDREAVPRPLATLAGGVLWGAWQGLAAR